MDLFFKNKHMLFEGDEIKVEKKEQELVKPIPLYTDNVQNIFDKFTNSDTKQVDNKNAVEVMKSVWKDTDGNLQKSQTEQDRFDKLHDEIKQMGTNIISNTDKVTDIISTQIKDTAKDQTEQINKKTEENSKKLNKNMQTTINKGFGNMQRQIANKNNPSIIVNNNMSFPSGEDTDTIKNNRTSKPKNK